MRVLILPDQDHWTLDFVANGLVSHLSDFDWTKKKLHRRIRGRSSRKYDLVYVMYPPYLREFDPDSSSFIATVNSFCEIGNRGNNEYVDPHALQTLSLFKRVSAPCRSLCDLLKRNGIDAYLTPLGYDPSLFYPRERYSEEKFVVGFVGDPYRHGTTKGFHDFVLPALGQFSDIKFQMALCGDSQLPYHKMREFYSSIDVLVCMSETESGPMPVIESMACGTPVISTAVGVVPEIVTHLTNGIVVERTVDSLVSWISYLKENRGLVSAMGRASVETIKSRTWPAVIDKWKDFFIGNRN